MPFAHTVRTNRNAMERATATNGLLHVITEDHQLFIVREDQEPHVSHGTQERQLEEWRDMIHRLRDAERAKRA